MISKIRMINYKSFKDETIEFNSGRNILVGENGCGKSSILMAISLVLRGSYTFIEKVGLESLFNVDAVNEFQSKLPEERNYYKLPELVIELYFEDDWEKEKFDLNGKQNLDKTESSGLKLEISPNDSFSKEIANILKENSEIFPYDYYKVSFETFAGKSYSSYKKIHHTSYEFIDSSSVSIDFSMRKVISTLFEAKTSEETRKTIRHNFRISSDQFSQDMYGTHGIQEDGEYRFKIRSSASDFVNQFITAHKGKLDINNLGQGEKLLIIFDSILEKNSQESKIILVEEPENHLSYLNMQKLINLIEREDSHQLFISTHNNMIASRLDLSKVIFLKDSGSVSLSHLKPETGKFFKKAPNTNVLNFILSNKVILVEGDAEYILMDWFFKEVNSCTPENAGVGIISCGGKTFKRYIELAKKLNVKVAIITDNDGDYNTNIYTNYNHELQDCENIKIFADKNNENRTFEISLYNSNMQFFESKLGNESMINGVQEFMLNNKAESAFRTLNLLEEDSNNDFQIPQYIKEALLWIK